MIEALISSYLKENPDETVESTYSAINGLLRDAGNANAYLLQTTPSRINAEIYTAVGNSEVFYEKLKDCYRPVAGILDLQKGRYIRWLFLTKNETLLLHTGAIIISIDLDEEKILCKIPSANKFVRLQFNDVLIFVKLSAIEQLVLRLQE